MTKKTGTTSGIKRKKGTSKEFPVTFGFVITVPSDQSHLILLDLLQSIEAFSFSGGKLELESHTEHSQKREMERTLRVQHLSSGTATGVKQKLSSMNFEERSVSSTFCDGLINILSWWTLKDLQLPYEQTASGSLQTSHQNNGIPELTTKRSRPFDDVSRMLSTMTDSTTQAVKM